MPPSDPTSRETQARRIGVSHDGTTLTRGGEPWPLVADTIWSAFTHVTDQEWRDYVELRRTQGFSALLISMLPIVHDMTVGSDMPAPVPGFWDGHPRWGALDEGYLDHAARMLGTVVDNGLVPCLVTVWCDYAPWTWASRPRPAFAIPDDRLDAYLESVTRRLDRYDPVWLMAGDTDFNDPRIASWYGRAETMLRRYVPDAVTCMHTQDTTLVPPGLDAAMGPSFRGYQSGHRLELQENAWIYAEAYRSRPTVRPVIDLEPAYEGSGHGFRYGRFNAADVRRVSWQALLSGASAGIGYGAQGVWGWHGRGAPFNGAHFSGIPFDHATALRFPGAGQVVRAMEVVNSAGLLGAPGRQDLLLDPPLGVRAAGLGDHALVYVPYAWDVSLAPGLRVREASILDPDSGATEPAELSPDGSTIRQHEWNSDAVLDLRLEKPLA